MLLFFGLGDGEDPAEGPGILIEFAQGPLEPQESGLRTTRTTVRPFDLFHIVERGVKLRLDALPALAQRALGGVGQPIDDGGRRPGLGLHAEFQPRQGVLTRSLDERPKQIDEARVQG